MTTTVFNHGTVTGYKNHHCRCDLCRAAWRQSVRHRRGSQPSLLAREVERLNHELESAYLHIESLRDENARLCCRIDELEPR